MNLDIDFQVNVKPAEAPADDATTTQSATGDLNAGTDMDNGGDAADEGEDENMLDNGTDGDGNGDNGTDTPPDNSDTAPLGGDDPSASASL